VCILLVELELQKTRLGLIFGTSCGIIKRESAVELRRISANLMQRVSMPDRMIAATKLLLQERVLTVVALSRLPQGSLALRPERFLRS